MSPIIDEGGRAPRNVYAPPRQRGLLRPGYEPEEERSGDVRVLDVCEYEPPRLTSKTWRQLIHKVWEVDPLVWRN